MRPDIRGNEKLISELERLANSTRRGGFQVSINTQDLPDDQREIAELLERVIKNCKTVTEYELLKYRLTNDVLGIAHWDMKVRSANPIDFGNEFLWSNEFRHLIGFESVDDFPNILSSWSDRLHPDDKSRVLASFSAHITDTTGETPYNLEYRLLTKQGHYRHFRAIGVTMRDESGAPLRVAGAMEDITERVRRQEHTRLLLDATPLACRLWNKDHVLIECNEAAAKLFKLGSKQEYIDRYFELIPERQPSGEPTLGLIMGSLTYAFDHGYCRYEMDYRATDGAPIPAENTLVRVPYGDDFVVASYSRDLREHKKMLLDIQEKSSQLEIALDDAREANDAKSNFLAQMSHEIRTPLNAVVGLSELALSDEGVNADIADKLEKIHGSGITILSIINDILDISKIESGRYELSEQRYDTPSLINDIITLNIVRIGEKPIEFKLEIDESFPSLLYGDDLRVKQIFNNLLSNAFKYTDAGSVKWKISSVSDGKDTWIESSITDTGVGIKTDDLSKLFSDYAQVGRAPNRKIEGTGLGLAITKRLVDMMDGSIELKSEYGKGTEVFVRLRQERVGDVVIGRSVASSLMGLKYMLAKRAGSTKLPRIDLSYASVLVVDDIATNLDVVKGMLKPYKLRVDCASSGKQAVEMVRAQNPKYDAVFMDHMMPGMDGLEATRIIREDMECEYAQKIPVIALTANAIVGNEEMFLSSGFQAFISKPIDVSRLDAVLRRWVRDRDKELELYGADIASDIFLGAEDSKQELPLAHGDEATMAMLAGTAIAGLDVEKALKLFDGDEMLLLDVMHSYAKNTPAILANLREQLEHEQYENYAIAAHGIKGSSNTLFAFKVGEAAEHLETAAKDGDGAYVKSNHDSFEMLVNTLLDNINAVLSRIDAAMRKPTLSTPDNKVLEELRNACKAFDIRRVNAAVRELDRFSYKNGNELVKWLNERVEDMDFEEIASGQWPS